MSQEKIVITLKYDGDGHEIKGRTITRFVKYKEKLTHLSYRVTDVNGEIWIAKRDEVSGCFYAIH